MVYPEMSGYSAQVHPIHIQLDRFLVHLFWISPGLRFWSVLDLAEHAAIALATAVCFFGSVLPFGSVTFWTFNHDHILSSWPIL